MTLEEASKKALSMMPPNSTIKAAIEEGGLFLFIIWRDDPLEGRYDPFYSLNPNTMEFRDFDPLSYSDSQRVLPRLQEAFE